MRRSAVRLITMGMAFVMMLWGSPLLTPQAMEVSDFEQDMTTAAPETEGEQTGEVSDPDLFQGQIRQASQALERLAAERAIIATLYRTDRYPLTAAPGYGESGVTEIPSGGQVMIQGVESENGAIWYLVCYAQEEQSYRGYVQAEYLISTDQRFLDWQQEYLSDIPLEGGLDDLVRADSDILAFPESYRSYLAQLKSRHPNWVFVPMNTNLEWETVITEEMRGDRSWVHSSKPAPWKGEQRDKNWYLATRPAVEYCVDPRNFLNEKYIFMFEQLTYNGNYHTVQGVQNIVQNTFMRGDIPGEGISYSQNFFNLGQALGVSPFHLASRVYQEQGVNGTSALISGTYPGYEGYYNYYNVSASGTTDQQVIESGLKYAKSKGWNTRRGSIAGGAEFISKNYILKGQDTLYLQKFDVDNSYNGLFYHQYMQNITAPMTEGSTTRAAYERAGALGNRFVFKIPVYRNMPAAPCPEPGTSQPVVPPSVTPEQEAKIKAFIVRLYVNVLDRQSYADSEVDYWYQKLVSKESTGVDVACGFFFSNEFKAKGLSNDAYVDILYRVMFDRGESANERKYWTDKLEIGMSREYVYAGFANSNEFMQICNDYGVNRGTMNWTAYRDQNEGVTAFVTRLYNKALNRGGDDGGMEMWPRVILRREKTVEEVAYGFIFSPEFLNKHHGNEEYVKILYRTFMDREAGITEIQYWMNKLNEGAPREEVFRGFARSPEFGRIMQEYGIAPY